MIFIRAEGFSTPPIGAFLRVLNPECNSTGERTIPRCLRRGSFIIKCVSKAKVIITFSPLLIVRRYFFFFLCFLFFISCQTAPKVTDEAQLQVTVPLDSGASVYLFANVNEMRFIFDLLPIEELKDNQVRQMLDRTGFAAAALFPKESGRQYQIAAWGNYPSSSAAMAFTFNKDWKKQRTPQGYNYWYSSANRLSVALNARQIFAASWLITPGNHNPMAEAGIEYPEGFTEFRGNAQTRTAPFSCWLSDPEPVINKVLEDSGIPIMIPAKKLFINLFPVKEDSPNPPENSSAQGRYEAEIELQFESASQARGISTALAFAAMFMPALQGENTSFDPNLMLASILFANPPVQENNNINIKTSALSHAEIELLLKLFMVNK